MYNIIRTYSFSTYANFLLLLQRRKTTSGMFYDWLTVIILLLVTIAINTAVLDEIVAALNEELPDLAR